MSYKEHAGYRHMQIILDKRSKNYAVSYYKLLSMEQREELRGCLARLNGELEARRRAFEELENITEKMNILMSAPNQLTREISSDSEIDSPRNKRQRSKAVPATVAPVAPVASSSSGWGFFGGSGNPPPPPPPATV